jgi:hypothetical protein
MPFEVLDILLVLLGFLAAGEGAEVASLAGGGVLLAGIETIFAGFELADHRERDAFGQPGAASDSARALARMPAADQASMGS